MELSDWITTTTVKLAIGLYLREAGGNPRQLLFAVAHERQGMNTIIAKIVELGGSSDTPESAVQFGAAILLRELA